MYSRAEGSVHRRPAAAFLIARWKMKRSRTSPPRENRDQIKLHQGTPGRWKHSVALALGQEPLDSTKFSTQC